MKNIQLWINKNYETIKLLSLGAIFICVLLILYASKLSTDELKRDSALQTQIITNQLTATCVILVETVPAETLAKIDPPLEERCRDLATEAQRQQDERDEEQTKETAAPQQSQQSQVQPVLRSNATVIRFLPPEPEPTPEPVVTPSPAPQPEPVAEPTPEAEPEPTIVEELPELSESPAGPLVPVEIVN